MHNMWISWHLQNIQEYYPNKKSKILNVCDNVIIWFLICLVIKDLIQYKLSYLSEVET